MWRSMGPDVSDCFLQEKYAPSLDLSTHCLAFCPTPPYPDGFRRRMSHPLSSMYLYTRMAMPIAIRAKKTLDMNMMQRQETPPRMDKDLFGKVVL